MATRPRPRKRVFALRRAPDGSAFQRCGICGVSVAIAVADIHEECEHKMESKRFRGTTGVRALPKTQPRLIDQPATPFRLFMDRFAKQHQIESLFEVERMGFEKWQKMSEKEKYPYVFHSKMVDSFHQYTLNREAEEIVKVDDEADSPLAKSFSMVEKKVHQTRVMYIDSSDSENWDGPSSDE